MASPSMSGSTEQSIRFRFTVLIAANLLASVFGFATMSLIAWRFGAAAFGEIAFAQSIIVYAIVAATCGTELHAIRTVAHDRSELGAMASSVMLVRFALALVVYAIVAASSFAVPPFQAVRPLILLFGLSVFTTAINVSWIPQALHRTHVFAFANLSVQVVAFGGLFLVLLLWEDLTVVPLAKVFAELCAGAALLIWMRRRVGRLRRVFSRKSLLALLRRSAPIGGTQLLRGVALGSDLIILGLLVTSVELGHYAAAFKIFMMLTGFATAYFVILLPRLAARKGDSDGIARELRASFRRVMPVFVAGAVLLALIAAPLLQLLFGPSFRAAAGSLRILCLALLVNIVLRHYRQVLLVRNRQDVDLSTSTIGGIGHVVFKLALIPMIGIAGAALGTLLGEVLLLILQRRAARAALRPHDVERA